MESGEERALETPESAIDRISSLPTEVLHNILYLVQIRYAVRMRRLSKRWRKVCESLQFICLSEREFQSWTVEKFSRFVNNLLLLRAKADLHTFQLHWCCSRYLNFHDVMMWIAYAVKHKVKVLDMEMNGYDRTFLPHCVFTCPSLQELNLQLGGTSYGPPELPATIKLPSLRKLTLADVQVSQLSLDQIIAQSPGLEDLNFINCVACFDLIDSKVLKSLTLHGLKSGLDSFTVGAPHLIHFQCIDFPLGHISWRERPCLESAHIESSGHTFDGKSDFTGIILHAKRIKLLTGTDLKVMLEKELPTCSVFENLEYLQIGDWCLIDSLCIILRFLQLSPRLKNLILSHSKETGQGTRRNSIPSNELKFQCPHLQTVKIQCCKADIEVATIVKTMVDNGVSVEKIQVIYYEDLAKRGVSEVTGTLQKEWKEYVSLENMLKENPEWAEDSSYGGSESDNSDDESWGEDDDNDGSESGDAGEDDSGGEISDEIEDEDGGNMMEDDDEDDDDMDDVGLGNSEHGDDDL